MPDHFHCLISPNDSKVSVSKFIGAFKSKSTRIAWQYGIKGQLWRGRFYDDIVRKSEDARRIAGYILDNPVRKGIVECWEEYQYCGTFDELIL